MPVLLFGLIFLFISKLKICIGFRTYFSLLYLFFLKLAIWYIITIYCLIFIKISNVENIGIFEFIKHLNEKKMPGAATRIQLKVFVEGTYFNFPFPSASGNCSK